MKKGKSVIISVIAAVIVLIGGWLQGPNDANTDTYQEAGQNLEQDVNQNSNQNNENLEQSGNTNSNQTTTSNIATIEEVTLDKIPKYTDAPYVVINNNNPFFTKEDYTTTSFETFSDLDALGRCGVAYVNVGVDIMPTEPRGDIGHVKPTGWKSVKYDIVEGKNLYNRCHLIGFQLTGENANKENLITGTRYFNVQGMLPFENMIADYVKETENHVLYRVTPMYEGDNLVAYGALMEAWSVEDDGEGVCFNIFAYNIQPGIVIDYATGESALAQEEVEAEKKDYVLNTSGKKFHYPDCSSATSMKAENKQEYTGTRENLILQGYEPCGKCNP